MCLCYSSEIVEEEEYAGRNVPYVLCLSIYQCVFQQDYSKSYEPIFSKPGGQVGHDPGNNPLNIVTGRPDGGAGIATFMF